MKKDTNILLKIFNYTTIVHSLQQLCNQGTIMKKKNKTKQSAQDQMQIKQFKQHYKQIYVTTFLGQWWSSG